MTVNINEFKQFHEALTTGQLEYKPWYFMLNKGEKDPLGGQGWKADKHQLSFEKACDALKMGYNIGIAGTDNDGLVIIDVDDTEAFKGHSFIPTLTARSSSRVGMHHFYFTLDPNAKVNIPLEHAGELRTNWQYVVAPGSYAKLSDSKDDTGNITKTANDKLMALPDTEKEHAGKYTLESIMPPGLITYADIPQIFKDEKEKRDVKENAKLNRPKRDFTKKSDSNNSALFDLSIDDVVTSINDRGRHPSLFHDSHTGKNTSISDELLHCWRHNVSHNAISALSVMAGIYDCVDAGTGHKNSGSGSSCIDYDDGETIFKIWNYAKENGYISKSDSIPSKAMTWLALENKLCGKSDLIDGWKLPSGVYIQLMELLSPKEDKKQTDEPKKDTPKKTIQDKLNELTISEDQLDNVTSAITFVKSELNGQLMPYKVAFIETYLKPHFSFSSKTTSEIITEMKSYFKEKKIQDKFKAHELKKQEELKNKEQEDTIPEKNIEEARKIIYAGDPVKKIIETHATMHVGDEPLALALLVSIGIQSVLNSDGIHPKVSGTSGKGKSHCCKTMMHLIPNKYKFNTTLSDKVIYYMGIPDGAVVFSDDIDLSETLEGIIKRATSNFQEGDNYTTLDKNLDVKELYIPPRISWWLTSVDDDQSIQLLNRQFGGGIDESIEQDNDVYISQVGGAITGELVLPENGDIDICRYIIKDIKQQLYTVVIPYARGFEWTDKTNRRNFPIFLDIIKAFAVLRHRQRYKTEKNILIANIDDYNDAKDLYIGRAKNQGTKLTDVELKLCMALNGAGDVDYKYLQKKLGVSQGRISQIINGKKRGDSGLINKVPGFFAEQQNVKITEDTHVRKMVCSLDGFEPLSNFGTVITLKEEAIDMFYEYYPSITPVLPDKNITPLTDITLLPKYILYTEEKKSNTLCVKENKSMCLKSGIQGNKVITPQPIAKEQGNSEGNSEGVLPHIPKTAQLQLMRHLQEFKKAQYRGTPIIDINPHGMFIVGFLDAHPLLYRSQVARVTAAIEQMNRSGWR